MLSLAFQVEAKGLGFRVSALRGPGVTLGLRKGSYEL